MSSWMFYVLLNIIAKPIISNLGWESSFPVCLCYDAASAVCLQAAWLVWTQQKQEMSSHHWCFLLPIQQSVLFLAALPKLADFPAPANCTEQWPFMVRCTNCARPATTLDDFILSGETTEEFFFLPLIKMEMSWWFSVCRVVQKEWRLIRDSRLPSAIARLKQN